MNKNIYYDDINTFFLNIKNNIILFYDIFIKNNTVFIIAPLYDNYIINHEDIKIIFNNIELKNKLNFKSTTSEKIVIKGYKLENNDEEIDFIKLNVFYNNLNKEFELINYKSSYNYFLTQTTLFKYDIDLIDIFYKYYINNGVEHFYFYYNDYLNDSNPNYHKIINKIKYKKIKLIEWPFPYWDNIVGRHLCQMGQINHSLYKYGKANSQYMIFNDLDEYMYLNNNSKDSLNLYKYIKKDRYGIYLFENYWSLTLDTKIPNNFPDNILKSIKSDGDNFRTKCIVETSKINIMGVHKPYYIEKTILYNTKVDNSALLHFCNWSNPGRIVDTQYDYFKLNPIIYNDLNYNILKNSKNNIEKCLEYDFNDYIKKEEKKNKQIIFSRFNEDLNYIKDNANLFSNYDIIIYNKGPEINCDYIKERCKIVNLENVGRESHSYLYHIIENYNNLYNFNLFLPVSFFKNERKREIVLNILKEMLNLESANIFYHYILSKPVYEELYDFILDEWKTTNDENKKLLNKEDKYLEISPIRPFGKWYLENIGETKNNKVSFYGIFGVKKENILKYNIDFYKKLLSFVDNHINPEVGHYIERTWCSLFID